MCEICDGATYDELFEKMSRSISVPAPRPPAPPPGPTPSA